MVRADAIGAVVRLLEATAENDDLVFVRKLPPAEQAEARAYLAGLIEHARQRKSVPYAPPQESTE